MMQIFSNQKANNKPIKIWIFQANPDRYEIIKAFKEY